MDNDAISAALFVPSGPCTTRNPLVPMSKYRPDSGPIDTSVVQVINSSGRLKKQAADLLKMVN
jgi:hypothetical protein